MPIPPPGDSIIDGEFVVIVTIAPLLGVEDVDDGGVTKRGGCLSLLRSSNRPVVFRPKRRASAIDFDTASDLGDRNGDGGEGGVGLESSGRGEGVSTFVSCCRSLSYAAVSFASKFSTVDDEEVWTT
jgi:hypothetical protein